ncbi:MAG: hypothetical protein Q8M57_14350 [Nitrosomonas sp.]|uniref:hypothetical protein n=1 Tax=Nitrosomonas sp. TaxID=42353 RepID=UPI00273535A6|nr:hypothetical protein [Nitrosomonas sp.]MDP3282199.1 hypothetical protein [Nitrosomonas sp.]
MRILLLKVGFICLLLTGCQATHLVYVHGTTVGLDVSASTEGTGRLVFGYDRDTFAIVPRTSDQAESDAMSLAAVSCVYAWGLDDVQFQHFVSTGKTAISIVQDDQALKKIKNSIQGGGKKCTPE